MARIWPKQLLTTSQWGWRDKHNSGHSWNSILALLKDDKKAKWCFLTILPLAQRLMGREKKKTGQLGSYYFTGQDTGLSHSPLGNENSQKTTGWKYGHRECDIPYHRSAVLPSEQGREKVALRQRDSICNMHAKNPQTNMEEQMHRASETPPGMA